MRSTISIGFMPSGRWRMPGGVSTCAVLLMVSAGPAMLSGQKPATPVQFESDVLPIFKTNCVACHGVQTRIKEMDLSTLPGVVKGSESGPVVVAGKPDESRLYQMVSAGKMPPGSKTGLPKEQIDAIRAWIETMPAPANKSVEAAADSQDTETEIAPLMYLRCTVCHGPRRQEGGLDLRTRDAMLKGGTSGPAIVLGKPEESLAIRKIRSGEMPPKKELMDVSIKPITTAETERLAQWIARGAPKGTEPADVAGNGPDPLVSDSDRRFWAFQPPRAVAVPAVKHAALVRNPVDAFLLDKLERKGLQFSPEADRPTLLRRAYLDLTGLPPEPAEVQAFLADRDPAAYEKVIDRLLASPRYGERWGRHWLDVAGYADSEGGKLTNDVPRDVAFRYRDYVIRSFNADKPYDRFLTEQLAGDELADYEHAATVTPQMLDNVIATGFLRMGPDSTIEHNINFVDDHLDVIADEIDIFSSSVLGLTVKCAKCHSHKYDPIPQRDYYRLKAVFQGALDEHDWLQAHASVYDDPKDFRQPEVRLLPYITPGATPVQIMEEQRELETRNHNLDLEIKNLKAALDEKAEPYKKKIVDQRLAQLPESLRDDLIKVKETPPDKRNEVQKYLAEKFDKVLKVDQPELKQSDAVYRKLAEETERQVKLLEYRKAPDLKIRALWDRGAPSPTYIQKRGDPNNYGRLVGPGVPAVLTDGKTPFDVQPPWPGANKTGRRLALARWVTQPDNPLTARVMVNRIWKHHFGVGIVRSLGNFGKNGTPPTHPELLDWLAKEFVRQGWSVKAMHRTMMMSTAYRQSSAVTPAVEQADPQNQLVSRMTLQRMEAEVLYDSLLAVAGRLDETRFGVPEPVMVREDGLVTPLGTGHGWRRSIYVEQLRTKLPTLLENYDLPAMSPNCVSRSASLIATQALHLMNNGMIDELAASFAARVQKEVGADPLKQVERAYLIALGRSPGEEEKRISLEALRRLRGAEAPGVPVPPKVAAKPAGETGLAKLAGEDPERLALAEFCHTLMNSAAFLYVD